MSSLPPLVPAAAIPPVTAYSPSAVAPTDYGPVGTEPKGPNVLYWPEPEGGTVMLRISTIVTIMGVFMAFAAPLFGIAVAVVGGLAMYGLSRTKRGPHHDYICDGYGITMRHAEGKVPMPPSVYPWSQVTGLDWTSRTVTSDGGNLEPDQNFTVFDLHVRMRDGAGPTLDEFRLGKMEGLMECIHAHTPQLSYRWVPADSIDGLPIQARAGKYVRIAR